ncbi:hypothetical protein [Roseibium marinum]|uniref:Uncharacterized protein n=1 Tax=Roseibium marinum TaxID=281252 RepID=A0A2S3UWL3_9HYPH|nr:hypothetical protein [Roseibium marinum]POF32105.1 hypothetical protein CLV41_10324 [Roseibium marinum]
MLRPENRENGGTLVPVSFATLAALLALLAPPAFAEEPPGDCEIDPEREETETRNADEDVNARRLADCDGILHPAPVGDTEMVQPARETGEMPVIDPEELPDRQGRQ